MDQIAAFVFGVLSSIVAGFTLEWMKGIITFRTSDYPNMKGIWVAKTKLGDKPLHLEQIDVRSQFGRTIKGVFTTPDPIDSDKTYQNEFEGYIINSTTVRFSFVPKGNYEDYGVGIIQLESNYKKATGLSVSVGISSKNPEIAQFEIDRK
jgi:hypothetical protein